MPYFAYCTLLDEAEMQKFVPTATRGAVGSVEGQRVVFERHGPDLETGGCNLAAAAGETVFGVLYDLTDEEFAKLDEISGVPRGLYRRVAVTVKTGEGAIDAETYVIPNSGGPFTPSELYVQPILTGARALRLPDANVVQLEAMVKAATG